MAENWNARHKAQKSIINSFDKWQATFVKIVAERDKRVNDPPSLEKNYFMMKAEVLAQLTSTITTLKEIHKQIEGSIPREPHVIFNIQGGGNSIYAMRLADKYKELVARFNNDTGVARPPKTLPPQKFKKPSKPPKRPIPKLRNR